MISVCEIENECSDDPKKSVHEVVCFKANGEPGLTDGQPIFFLRTGTRVILLQAQTAYLNDWYIRNIKRTPSVHTWAAAAQAIKNWTQFLYELPNFSKMRDNPDVWKMATREDRIFWRDCYMNYTKPSGEDFSKNTIASRMTVIAGLYRWATDRGEYFGDMTSALTDTHGNEISIDEDALAHTRRDSIHTKVDDGDLPKASRYTSDKVNPLEPNAVVALLNSLGPSPENADRDRRPCRNRVIADLVLDTGIRIAECMDLNIYQFLQIVTNPDEPFAAYSLKIANGKGSKSRNVNVHGWVVEIVQKYIEGERARSLAAKGKTKSALAKIWLNHADHRLAGKPLTKRGLQKAFTEACIRAGLVVREAVQDGSTLEFAAHSIHDLRHTFSVRYCEAEWQLGNTEPWLALSRLLGHSSPTTTKNCYLRFVDLMSQRNISFVSKNQKEI